MAKPRILVVSPVPPAVAARIADEFDAIMPFEGDPSVDQIIAAVEKHQAEALTFTVRFRLNAEAIAKLPACVKVLSCYSVGYEHIDVKAAQARGILVTYTPDVLTNANADLTLMLMLCAARRAHEYDSLMRKGWRQAYGLISLLGTDLSGKTLGIVGMGRIGRAVAKRARGFDMKILYHNRSRLPAEQEQGATYYERLEDMLPHSQVLTLHLPGRNGHVIRKETLDLLPRGAIVISASRGDLVDEDALIEALKDGRVGSAGIDVFQSEPDFDLRFAELPNVFLTPHMGSATIETRTAMGMLALDNIVAALAGKPQNVVQV